MGKLSPQQLRDRLTLDYKVCQRMFGTVFSGEAYRTDSDFKSRRNSIKSLDEGHLALKYCIDFHVRTLVGQGQYSDLTTIGFDLGVGNYPFEDPISWVISTPVPYSPHFTKGKPVCIGPIWETAHGKMLFGELLVHVARLLNWDTTTSSNHNGFNPEAVAYHRRVHGGKPINPNLRFPLVPEDLLGLSATSPQKARESKLVFRPHLDPNNGAEPKRFRIKGIE